MAAKRVDAGTSKLRRPPATTPEARENQMVALAFDVAEKQMLSGEASSQVITHFLKLGSRRARLEEEKIRNENLLAEAKIAQIESSQRVEALYADAIKAMRVYGGHAPAEDDDVEE